MVLTSSSSPHEFFELCQKFVGDHWNHISIDEVDISPHLGGLSNYLVKCFMKNPPEHAKYPKVLVRLYSPPKLADPSAVLLDTTIFGILSERNFGPKLLGVFENGRIEEFVESRPATVEEIRDRDISMDIARLYYKMHNLDMPLNKSPEAFFDILNRWTSQIKNFCAKEHDDTELAKRKEEIVAFFGESSILEELEWIRSIFLQEFADKFPVVFSHNDLQSNNVLYIPDKKSSKGYRLLMIDFEFSSYCYRGYDMANHFCEWMFDYTVNDWPYYICNEDKFPNEDQQNDFLRAYFSDDSATVETDGLRLELAYGVVLSHLTWTLWAVIEYATTQLEFAYLHYAKNRFKLYNKAKNRAKSIQ